MSMSMASLVGSIPGSRVTTTPSIDLLKHGQGLGWRRLRASSRLMFGGFQGQTGTALVEACDNDTLHCAAFVCKLDAADGSKMFRPIFR